MKECPNCKSVLSGTEKAIWKCAVCGKMYRIDLQRLEKISSLIKEDGSSVVTCRNCGNGLKDNEKIFWRCVSCESTLSGDVKQFRLRENKKVVDGDKNFFRDNTTDDNARVRRYINKRNFGLLISVLVVTICIIYKPMMDAINYRLAVSAYENGEYEKAYEKYEKLGDYKDSEIRLISAEKKAFYSAGKEWNEKGEYEKAIEAFSKIPDYKDVPDLMVECKYSLAESKFLSRSYDKALDIYVELAKKSYLDSVEKKKACYYMLGSKCYEEKKYSKAITYLGEIETSYKNSNEIFIKSYYEYFVKLLSNRKYMEACQLIDDSARRKNKILRGMRKLLNYQDKLDIRKVIDKLFTDACFKEVVSLYTVLYDIKNSTLPKKYYLSECMLKLQGGYKNMQPNKESLTALIEGWNITLEGKKYILYNKSKKEGNIIELLYLKESNKYIRVMDASSGDVSFLVVNANFERGDDKRVEGYYWSNERLEQKEQEEIERKKKEPYIGMTHEEVENSTWGKPNDINKTTFAWGVKEQWCYSGYRYIYFRDGKVEAISE